MKVYKDIYNFKVISEIKSGHDVFVVDRLVQCVASANKTQAEELLAMIEYDETGRYSFYKIVEEDFDAENI